MPALTARLAAVYAQFQVMNQELLLVLDELGFALGWVLPFAATQLGRREVSGGWFADSRHGMQYDVLSGGSLPRTSIDYL